MPFSVITGIFKYVGSNLTLFSKCKPGFPEESSPQPELQDSKLQPSHRCYGSTAELQAAPCFGATPEPLWAQPCPDALVVGSMKQQHALPSYQLFPGWQSSKDLLLTLPTSPQPFLMFCLPYHYTILEGSEKFLRRLW